MVAQSWGEHPFVRMEATVAPVELLTRGCKKAAIRNLAFEFFCMRAPRYRFGYETEALTEKRKTTCS